MLFSTQGHKLYKEELCIELSQCRTSNLSLFRAVDYIINWRINIIVVFVFVVVVVAAADAVICIIMQIMGS
jgi:hypothetical protein